MKINQAQEILSKLRGYWATPAMDEDEERVWLQELTDHDKDVRFEDVAAVISRLSSDEIFRPRAGSVVAMARKRHRDAPKTNCPTCGGTGMREMEQSELPCHRGVDGCYMVVSYCRCVVSCTDCEDGKVPWAPDPEDTESFGAIAKRRAPELRELIRTKGVKRVEESEAF